MNVLVLGGGGREYALAWALARSRSVVNIDVAPGNAGTALFARQMSFGPRDIGALERHIAGTRVDLAIVGPDDLIEAGIGDVLRRTGIAVVGPSREAGKIEWSKAFAKRLMDEAGVPCAKWESHPTAAAARAAVASRAEGPVVVKADGLAGGKGVVVAGSRAEALEALLLPQVASGAIVLEEALVGEEVSLHALVDGETVVALPPAKDHKRVGVGDTGANTGGMGAVSPTDVLPDGAAQALADTLIAPIARLLRQRGTPYHGVIFAGLIKTAGGWRVIEYNARFGDPETQVMLPRLAGDFGVLMLALGEGKLAAHVAASPLRFEPRAYVSVALCAEGYPGAVRTGEPVDGLDQLAQGVYAFHGNTARTPAGVVTAGGRVIHVVAGGDTVEQARARAYEGAERVRFAGKFFRPDIGQADGAISAAPTAMGDDRR